MDVTLDADLFDAGWWFGTFFVFPYIGNIIPIDCHIFQRGGPGPPTVDGLEWFGHQFPHGDCQMNSQIHRALPSASE